MSKGLNGREEAVPATLEEALALIETERGTLREVLEEKKALESRILQAQKLESLGVVAAAVTHDFNNLLHEVIGNASLARVHIDDKDACLEALRHIEGASTRAATLTRQFLAYSSTAEFSADPVDIRELVRDMTVLLESSISKQISLTLTSDIDVPPISADSSQMQQLVMNLITNASEAIGDEPGEIRVHLGVADVTKEMLQDACFAEELREGRYVYLEVSDTGHGMSEETTERMFELFFSTKDSGKGLGLAAVEEILRAHEGAIHIQSGVGNGTSIRALFCHSTATVSQSESTEDSSRLSGFGTILVVDDDAEALEVSRNILEHFGCEVLLARDGRDGWDVYRKHADIIDLVLLDLTMPSMDGVAVLEQIRSVGGDAPVVVMTGYSEEQVKKRFGQIAPTDILAKPFRVETFIRTVQRHLERNPGVHG